MDLNRCLPARYSQCPVFATARQKMVDGQLSHVSVVEPWHFPCQPIGAGGFQGPSSPGAPVCRSGADEVRCGIRQPGDRPAGGTDRDVVAAIVVPGMTIIDGIVRTQRTRNTPPAGEGAGDRGTAAVEYRACLISPDLGER